MIKELIETLSAAEKSKLNNVVAASNNLPHKILELYIASIDIQQAQVEQKLNINSNSYFKNITLAKELIYEVIKEETITTYDDIFLVRTLIFRGLHVHANKLILKLEEKYLYEKWYGLLDVLYHESFRMAYNSCDVKELEKLNLKVKANLEKYHQYTLLDKQLLLDMARCEKHDIKPNEITPYLKHLEKLYKDCHTFEHHVLEFNALHCLYEVHVNYTNDHKKAFDVIAKMKVLVETNKEKMNERIYANMLTHVVFPYCIYEIEEQPEMYFDYLFSNFKQINHHFIISEVLLHFSIYYFTRKDLKILIEMHNYMKEYAQEKSNQYKECFTACLIAYLEQNDKAFHQHKIRFYQTDESRDSLQCDLLLRYLEISALIHDNEYDIASDKIDAAEKFLKRNFSIGRVEENKLLFQVLRKKIKGKKFENEPLFAYRFLNFVLRELQK
ncbi:MAG: hypothetical protein U0U67_11385 [Chitinophagales bacterium]